MPGRRFLSLSILFLACGAGAATTAPLIRGPMYAKVPLKGAAQPHDVQIAASPFEGRVQDVLVRKGQWLDRGDIMIALASRELAAMLETEPTTPAEIMEKRWGKMYKPDEIRCDFDHCYVLEVRVKAQQTIRPGDPVLRYCGSLKVDSQFPTLVFPNLTRDLQAEMWVPQDRKNRLKAPLAETRAATRTEPAWIEVILPAKAPGVVPGTVLDGLMTVRVRNNALQVPSSAIRHIGKRNYIMLEVATGFDNGEVTEILTQIEEQTHVLVPEAP